jgi:hypothetical protein
MRRLVLPVLALATACVPSYEFAGQGGGDAALDAPPARDAAPDASPAADSTPPPPPLDAGDDAGVDANPPFVSLQDCVLLLHFEEPSWSGAGSLKDSSPAGNHGTPVGAPKTTANGKFGSAVQLDGASYFDIPDSASLHPTTALTMAAWLYPTALMPADAAVAYPGIVSKRADFGVNVEYTMFLWTGDDMWGDFQGNAQQYRFQGAFTFANAAWYHVAMVVDGSLPANARTTFYVNGQVDGPPLAGDPAFAAAPSPPPDLLVGYLNQGNRNPDPLAFFTGRIDEVAIWTRALSAGEIAALARATGPL